MLKKLSVTALVLALLVLVPLFVIPFFFDGDSVKESIEQEIASQIGRKAKIDGDLNFVPFPKPHFKLGGLRVYNAEHASTDYLLTVESVEVHPNLVGLLSGDVAISHVAMVRPIIELENFKNETPNWVRGKEAGEAVESEFSGVDIKIQEGKVFFRSGEKENPIERLIHIDQGSVVFESAVGPYYMEGYMRPSFAKQAMLVNLEAGKVKDNAPADFEMIINADKSKLAVEGDMVLLDNSPVVRGKITASLMQSLKSLADHFGVDDFYVPESFDKLLSAEETTLSSNILFNKDGVELTGVVLNSLATKAEGNASIVFGAENNLEIAMDFPTINLDMIAREYSKMEKVRVENPETTFAAPDDSRFGLPKDFNVRFKLNFGNATYNGKSNIQAFLDTEFAQGRTIVHKLSAEGLPGESFLDWSGEVIGDTSESTEDALFVGDAEIQGRKLLPLLSWLGINPPTGNREGFEDFRGTAKVRWSKEKLSLPQLSFVIDKSAARGRAEITTGENGELNANMAVSVTYIDLKTYELKNSKLSGLTRSAEENLAIFDYLRSADFIFDNLAIAFNIKQLVMEKETIKNIKGTFKTKQAIITLDKFSFVSKDYGQLNTTVTIDSTELKPKVDVELFIEKLNTHAFDDTTTIGQLLSTSSDEEIGWPSHSEKIPPAWSGSPINFSHLSIFDGKFEVVIQELVNPVINLQAARLSGTIDSRSINIKNFDARIFSSRVNGTGSFGLERPYIQMTFSIANGDLQDLLRTLFGYTNVTGKVSLSGGVSGSGYSIKQLVSSLAGNGKFVARDIKVSGYDIKKLARKMPQLNAIDEIRELKRSTLSSGVTNIDYASGNIALHGGVLKSSGVQLTTPSAQSTELRFSIDLTNWAINLVTTYGIRTRLMTELVRVAIETQGNIYNPETYWDRAKQIERYWEHKYYGRNR